MSAHLAQVKNRSWQREARFRIYKGTFNSMTHPAPGPKNKKFITQIQIENCGFVVSGGFCGDIFYKYYLRITLTMQEEVQTKVSVSVLKNLHFIF